MPAPSAETVLTAVTKQYLESGDFNGLPVRTIKATRDQRLALIASLVEAGVVSINLGDGHPNPHIKAFEPDPIPVQLDKLGTADLTHACLYPSAGHLATVVNQADYTGRPFTLRLALGFPQLQLDAFDLQVLERYRNDPRYAYQSDGIQGSISVTDKHFESADMAERDKVLLQHFGFGYSKDMTTRVVVAFVYDLAGLSPEHQQLWDLHRIDGEFVPHPIFWASMMGHWPDRESIFVALTEELRQINRMAEAIGRPPLFRNDFADEKRPKKLGFLIRPTAAEFNESVLLLDKMLSDNINKGFFGADIDFEQRQERSDGTLVVAQKGTITALKEWLTLKFRPADPKPLENMLGTLRKIRSLRQRPAHAVDEDAFDQKYFRDHRELVIEAYEAVRLLRLVLANHPRARSVEIPDWLYKGEITTW